MAFGEVFGNLKQKVRSVYNNFFYDGAEAPAPQEPVYQQDQPYQQPAYQAPQQAYAPQAEYAQPQQPVYQSPGYQQPQQYQQMQQPRNRRMQQHAAQEENNVVDFGTYQQAQQPVYQQPQQYQQPQAQNAPQQEAPQQVNQNVLASARVINARGMGDCRSAITLLRNGDAVLIVLENVTDPSELRRLVDTLSGACYSLTATITKVSRYGVYLLAPQTMAVYTDQVTSQMNNPGRTASRTYQSSFSAQRSAYQQPQQAAPQMNQGFTQRPAQVEEPQQPFYARTAPQPAPAPSFSAQPVGYGYVADELEAVAQQ